MIKRLGIFGLWIGAAALAQLGCKGPAGPSGSDAVLSDSLSPGIQWLSPSADTTVDTGLVLAVRAWDRTLSPMGTPVDTLPWRVAFFVASFEYPGRLADSAGFRYELSWDARRWPEAPYPVTARVWDRARNQADAPVFIIRVDHP